MFEAVATRTERRRSAEEILAPGSYLTDGWTLFHVISQFCPEEEEIFAALEDCYTLEVKPYGPDELCEMGLRPVSLAAAA